MKLLCDIRPFATMLDVHHRALRISIIDTIPLPLKGFLTRRSTLGSVVDTSFIDHLAQAIRIQTVAPDDPTEVDANAFDHFHRFLETTYPGVWSTSTVERFGSHGLTLTWKGSAADDHPLVLAAHQDVVPVEDAASWTHPPFAGVQTATHLYGRGAIDDKGSLIAILEATEALIADGFSPRRTLILAFGHDEESAGTAGAGAIAAALAARGARPALVLDEGGFVTEGVLPGVRGRVALIGTSEKGYADIELLAHSAPGHSSTPPRTTAIGRLARAVADIERRRMPARPELQRAFFEAISPAARRGMRRVVASLPRLGKLAERMLSSRPTTDALIRTSIAPTLFGAGTKANVLPGTARAVINVRILPGDTIAGVVDHFRRVAGRDVEVEVLGGWDPPPVSDHETPGFGAVTDAIHEVFGPVVCAPWIVVGATDARYYANICDTVLRFAPFHMNSAELTGFHGVDERVRIADSRAAVGFYRTLIRRFCG